jgi:hypothetical protein
MAIAQADSNPPYGQYPESPVAASGTSGKPTGELEGPDGMNRTPHPDSEVKDPTLTIRVRCPIQGSIPQIEPLNLTPNSAFYRQPDFSRVLSTLKKVKSSGLRNDKISCHSLSSPANKT